jgi:Thioredoxin-like/Domain of unknown function (DUF4369)
MKKVFYLLIILLTMVSCGKKPNFTITGRLDGGKGKTVNLNKLLINDQVVSDSVKIGQDGSFKFKGNTSMPTFYLLKLSEKSFITLLIDSTENVTITGSYTNFTRDYKVSGSRGSEMLRDLDSRFFAAKTRLDSLQKLLKSQQFNPASAQINGLTAQYNRIVNDHSEYVTSFVKRNPFSLASVYALYQKWNETNFVINDMQAMKTAASALYSVYPKNEQVIALYNNTLQFINDERNKALVNAVKNNAVNSPNIVLPDADGHNKELWSLHGKYVLLHFWSAKDRASRIVNPVLSEIYQKYKSRGFEIYMVSIDNDRAAWLEAIATDNLNCINVGDMKGSYQAVTNFNVQELPFNYLIDKEGNIIAKDLKGPVLNQVLSKIFK